MNDLFKSNSMSRTKEVWLPVIDWEKYYSVSNLGRVRSLPRYVTHQGNLKNMGIITRLYPSCILSQNKSGPYNMVSLAKNGIKVTKTVHRLVAQAWIQNAHNKPCINHKDLNKRHNIVTNLEWVTYKENEKHKHLNNQDIDFRLGERAVNTHLRNEEVVFIRWVVKNIPDVVNNDLADLFGVSYQGVNSIVKNRNWKSLELA